MRMLMAAILFIQAAPPQSEADKTEAALKKFGDRRYKVLTNGEVGGTLTLKTRIVKTGDQKQAVFEDGFAMKAGDVDVSLTYAETVTLPGLRFVSAVRAGKTPEGDFKQEVTVKDGKAVSQGKEEFSLDIGPETVGELAMLRLVATAEQKKDAAFKADVLSLIMPGHEPGHALRCFGKEEIEIGGKKLDAFKWKETGEWKHKFTGSDGREQTMNSNVDNTYWVSPDGYLLKFTFGSSEMILDSN